MFAVDSEFLCKMKLKSFNKHEFYYGYIVAGEFWSQF